MNELVAPLLQGLFQRHLMLLSQEAPEVYQRYVTAAPDYVGGVNEMQQLNNYWRIQLGALPINTTDVRGYLEDGIPESEWLSNFRRHVLPVIRSNRLPSPR